MSARFRLPAAGVHGGKPGEPSRDRDGVTVACSVSLLDGSRHVFAVNKQENAQMLLDYVCTYLQLAERNFFGLQIPGEGKAGPKWLDPSKPIKKQLGKGSSTVLSFRVKYFVRDPDRLTEEATRHLFYLQIKKDILEGWLPCPRDMAIQLASYVAQAELGNSNPAVSGTGYLSRLRFLPELPQDFLLDVAKQHSKHSGMKAADAVRSYLAAVKTLELYGVELHYARDGNNLEVMLGVMATGMVIYKNGIRIHLPWKKIVKIFFKSKQFFIQLERRPMEMRDNILEFHMESYRLCKGLWKACVEHHCFFRTQRQPGSSSEKSLLGQIFTLSLFKGRPDSVHRDSSERINGSRAVSRKSSSGRSGLGSGDGDRVGSAQLARRRNSDEIWDRSARLSGSENSSSPPSPTLLTPSGSFQRSLRTANSLGDLSRRVVGGVTLRPLRAASVTRLDSRQSLSLQRFSVAEFRAPGQTSKVRNGSVCRTPSHANSHEGLLNSPSSRSYDITDLTSSGSGQLNGADPYENLVLIRIKQDDNCKFGFNVKGGSDHKMPIIVSRVAPGTPADLCVPRLNEGDQLVRVNGRDVSRCSHEEVVQFIRSSCQGGGHDELLLLVRPNAVYGADEEEDDDDEVDSEPDFQYTALEPAEPHDGGSEGGQDALRLSMEQLERDLEASIAVEQFEDLYRKKPGMSMSCARLPQNAGKNRYRDISPYDDTRVLLCGEDDYINANHINMELADRVNRYIACQGPLPATSADFWQMVWEQGSTMIVMLTTITERGRVKCHQYWPNPPGTETYGDYVVTCVKEDCNLACVFREFTLTKKVAKPASRAEEVAEERIEEERKEDGEESAVEGGEDNDDKERPKKQEEAEKAEAKEVEANEVEKEESEEVEPEDCADAAAAAIAAASEKEEERLVSHLQYVAWPDHGVPDDPHQFLQFVKSVREKRTAQPPQPVIVHCSAGIGRTGVLVTMETAQCLMECYKPVYPLDIVKTMRDQRAMMIQTSCQYRFVCEAILQVYEEMVFEDRGKPARPTQ
ncbi:tyrosine-protein phosphatase non-receptor type 4-like isoform X2 [Lethenteron reissneri]|uniref:tyrosine-protein phosphatase non-receptor type 4-like isoform X2 n=1 Tax=Lethenteron reissneri TaxID=7753 RepID=UPI002AB71AED|nr:tyrosine-protein phosphatase non-receptor type 4-like isoform X2 [Lethenteron reissneri]